MVGDKDGEIEFRETFLSTYRAFTDAHTLVDLLVKRYEMDQPGDLTADEFDQWKDMKLRPTQLQYAIF
jgi:son of sevenless-like protein